MAAQHPSPSLGRNPVIRASSTGLLVGMIVGVIFIGSIGVGIALGLTLALAGGIHTTSPYGQGHG
jgi:hypothetical protein